MKTSQKDYLNWKKYMDDNNKMIDKKIKAKEVVENIIDYIKWVKYRYPRDENERWYNRGIDRAIDMIEDHFLF